MRAIIIGVGIAGALRFAYRWIVDGANKPGTNGLCRCTAAWVDNGSQSIVHQWGCPARVPIDTTHKAPDGDSGWH